MPFLKRLVSMAAAAAAMLAMLALPASAQEAALAESYTLTPEALIARIEQTYEEALDLACRRSFHGKCSTMVNCSTLALGIQNTRFDGDGRDEYDLYDHITRTEGGYDVIRYGAEEYGLEEALNRITENGTRDVYNLIVGFEGGRTATSSKYGHTCFIHGIVDGMVYYSESYDLYLNDTYYAEGEPIVCSIWEFADYYGKWAYYEGVIHFDFPDESAPMLSDLSVWAVSEDGFSVSFRASDNMEITELYAAVWIYGETEADARILPVSVFQDVATVRVDAADFGGFVGKYYVNCYAADRKGNVSVISTEDTGVSLYETERTEGIYRVIQSNVGVYDAPYIRVNGVNTREYAVFIGDEVQVVGSYVNDEGEQWCLLSDGGWVPADQLREIARDWETLWEQIQSFFGRTKTVTLSGML